jgi:glycine/D-amino acid oxidase-like deaminating enzyme
MSNRRDGVIGACTTYFLSLRGIEVIVIERAEVAPQHLTRREDFLASTGAPTPQGPLVTAGSCGRALKNFGAMADGNPETVMNSRISGRALSWAA